MKITMSTVSIVFPVVTAYRIARKVDLERSEMRPANGHPPASLTRSAYPWILVS